MPIVVGIIGLVGVNVRADGVDGRSRSIAMRKAERAKDAFLQEVRAELGVDNPAVDTALPDPL